MIANYISLARIFLSLTLIVLEPLSVEFIIVYCVCGISDILDGYIARKTNTVSEIGGKLDSISDFIMVIVLIIILLPIINITTFIFIWIAIIGLIKISSIVVAIVRFNKLGMLHTYGNKLTGLVLFGLLLLGKFIYLPIYIYIACIIATISAIEELLLNLLSDRLDINKKSILCLFKYKDNDL